MKTTTLLRFATSLFVMGLVIVVSSKQGKADDEKKKEKGKAEKKTYSLVLSNSNLSINGVQWENLPEEEKAKISILQTTSGIVISGDKLIINSTQNTDSTGSKKNNRIVVIRDSLRTSDRKIQVSDDKIILMDGTELRLPRPVAPPEVDFKMLELISIPQPPALPEGNMIDFEENNYRVYIFSDGDKNISVKMTPTDKQTPGESKPAATKTLKTESKAGDAEVKLYPNPSDGEFTIRFTMKEKSPVTIRVTDQLGKEVLKDIIKEYKGGSFEKKFRIDEFANGTYLVSIKQGKEEIIKKIILNK